MSNNQIEAIVVILIFLSPPRVVEPTGLPLFLNLTFDIAMTDIDVNETIINPPSPHSKVDEPATNIPSLPLVINEPATNPVPLFLPPAIVRPTDPSLLSPGVNNSRIVDNVTINTKDERPPPPDDVERDLMDKENFTLSKIHQAKSTKLYNDFQKYNIDEEFKYTQDLDDKVGDMAFVRFFMMEQVYVFPRHHSVGE